MKPLLTQKVPKAGPHSKIGDWISAKDQDTLDGLADFRARQEARRIAAQGQTAPKPIIHLSDIKRFKP